jgi:hypothetical protein
VGDVTYEGDAAAASACPNCEWSFNMSAVSGYTATGDYCDQLGPGQDGFFDGYFDYNWGFAYSYTYTYNGTDYPFEDAILLAQDSDDWFLFAYNYSSSQHVDGDATGFSFERAWFTSSGQYGAYFYP